MLVNNQSTRSVSDIRDEEDLSISSNRPEGSFSEKWTRVGDFRQAADLSDIRLAELEALYLSSQVSFSELIKAPRKLIQFIASETVLLAMPLIQMASFVYRVYACVSAGLSLSTKEGRLTFKGPLEYELSGSLTSINDSPISSYCEYVSDSIELPDTQGINIAKQNQALFIGGFCAAFLIEIAANKIEQGVTAQRLENTIKRGILNAINDYLKNNHQAVKKKAPPEKSYHSLFKWIQKIGIGMLMAYGSLRVLQEGSVALSFNGVNGISLLDRQTIPFQREYDLQCRIDESHTSIDSSTRVEGVITIPSSRVQGVEAPFMIKMLPILGFLAYTLGFWGERRAVKVAIEANVKAAVAPLLASECVKSQDWNKQVFQAILEALILNNTIPFKALAPIESNLKKNIEHYSSLLNDKSLPNSSSLLNKNTENTERWPIWDKIASMPTKRYVIKQIAALMATLSDNLFTTGMVVQIVTEGVPYISSGFNGKVTSKPSVFTPSGYIERDFHSEFGQSEFRDVTLGGGYQLEVEFPKTQVAGLESNLVSALLTTAMLLKYASKFIQSYLKRHELMQGIEKTQNDSSALDEEASVKQALDRLHESGHITYREYHGIKLRKPSLFNVNTLSDSFLNDAAMAQSRILSPRSVPRSITMALESTVLMVSDIAHKLGAAGIFLGVGARLTSVLLNGASIRFEEQAAVMLNTQSEFAYGPLSSEEHVNVTHSVDLVDLKVPNPSQVTLYIALIGAVSGSLLIPAAAGIDFLMSRKIIKNELARQRHHRVGRG